MTTCLLHASCVAIDSRAVLIRGPSGAGKSALALQLIAFGAELVADDRTELFVQDGALMARCPQSLHGLIEAREVGLLCAPVRAFAEVVLLVDLAVTETDRLPPRRRAGFLGVECDLVHGSRLDHFPAALLCYLKHGRFA